MNILIPFGGKLVAALSSADDVLNLVRAILLENLQGFPVTLYVLNQDICGWLMTGDLTTITKPGKIPVEVDIRKINPGEYSFKLGELESYKFYVENFRYWVEELDWYPGTIYKS